jgi:sugar lactone lactonase YvrE
MRALPGGDPLVLLTGLGLPESPRWRDGRLFFSDVWAGEVVAVTLDGRRETIAVVPGRPSGLGWLPDGRLLIVLMRERALWMQDGRVLRQIVDLAPFCGDLANDMLVDAKGRAYIGGFRDPPGQGSTEKHANALGANLILVDFNADPDNPVTRVVADDLLVPNGMALAADGATLIVAESGGDRLTAFAIAPDGSLSNRRLWAQLDTSPDGICPDGHGNVWVATHFPRNSFFLVAEGGAVLAEIETEAGGFACAFGGPAGRTLFLLEAPFPSQPSDRRGRIRILS